VDILTDAERLERSMGNLISKNYTYLWNALHLLKIMIDIIFENN